MPSPEPAHDGERAETPPPTPSSPPSARSPANGACSWRLVEYDQGRVGKSRRAPIVGVRWNLDMPYNARFARGRAPDNPAYAPFVVCPHRVDMTYTRHPCSCGRTFWPPHGRGRGESLTSPRRITAKMRAVEVLRLRVQGYTYAMIGARLGLSESGAWRAEQRLLAIVNVH